jgi:hypothetical protein
MVAGGHWNSPLAPYLDCNYEGLATGVCEILCVLLTIPTVLLTETAFGRSFVVPNFLFSYWQV